MASGISAQFAGLRIEGHEADLTLYTVPQGLSSPPLWRTRAGPVIARKVAIGAW